MGEIEFITFYPLHHQHLTDQFHTGGGDKHLTAEIKEALGAALGVGTRRSAVQWRLSLARQLAGN